MSVVLAAAKPPTRSWGQPALISSDPSQWLMRGVLELAGVVVVIVVVLRLRSRLRGRRRHLPPRLPMGLIAAASPDCESPDPLQVRQPAARAGASLGHLQASWGSARANCSSASALSRGHRCREVATRCGLAYQSTNPGPGPTAGIGQSMLGTLSFLASYCLSPSQRPWPSVELINWRP